MKDVAEEVKEYERRRIERM